MAETSKKYKVGELAKDFGLKNKDVIDLFAKHGLAGKSHTTALEDNEISLFLEALTQQNQVDITAYFKTFDDKKKAKKEEERKKAEEAQKAAEEARRKQKEAQAAQKRKANPNGQQPQQPQKQRSKTEVRVVDTRGTVGVDLGKYDEKLLSYDSGDNTQSGKQKIKKKNKFQTPDPKGKGKGPQGKQAPKPQNKPKPVQLTISVPDEITVSELASRMKQTVANVVKKLMTMGVMAGINDVIDYDTAYLLADEMGIIVKKEIVLSLEDRLIDTEADPEESLKHRAPVVVVMGHVDHGKTSLLDAIRDAHVTAGEAGGITQHIGAYSVHVHDQDITFLDTPGHEAFTAMRARGANMTDIAILVVAADDGIMPQTIEAINHAKAAGTPIIVAINKMDRPGANPDKIMTDLTNYELVPEAWGGDTICMPISALKRQGIDELLDMVLLTAEMMELKANPDRKAQGVVVEARLDKGKGTVATFLVQKGTLRTGDIVIAGTAVGRVRVMTNDKGRTVKEAGPSIPVEITGLSEVPNAGDLFYAVKDEKMARDLAEERKQTAKNAHADAVKVNLDDLFSQIGNGVQDLNIIVKADVQGSAEAVKQSLEKLSNEEVRVKVIHAAVGGITESDVMLASASNALIVGFNIRPDRTATDAAARDKVEIRTYRIIYDCIEEIKAAMKGMLAPEFKENVIGHAEVRQTIHVPGVGTIAGSYVTDGKVARNAQIRVLRDSVVIFEDQISSLKRFKDDAKEVNNGYECGIGLEKFNDIKVGDVLEAFVMEEVAR
ncbi:MAG: translation initiation factor IF-2 [Clostridia bacterium]|nr:translation initiation factor IF-2 [Clostridia bacterium]MBR4054919.1 translation initiation factor IF-2 [Clostridia bacterium]